MKLVVAIVQAQDAGQITDALAADEFRVTRMKTAGGFLRETNATLLLGVEDEEVDRVIGLIRENSRARARAAGDAPRSSDSPATTVTQDVTVRGATVFVLPTEGFERL